MQGAEVAARVTWLEAALVRALLVAAAPPARVRLCCTLLQETVACALCVAVVWCWGAFWGAQLLKSQGFWL
jgi:hypothetical protein